MDYEEMKAELASAMRELWKKKGEEEKEETEAKGKMRWSRGCWRSRGRWWDSL